MEGHDGCCRTVCDVLTYTIIQVMESKEAGRDDEINGPDDPESLGYVVPGSKTRRIVRITWSEKFGVALKVYV